MHYERDFTITAKETEIFYRTIALRRWRGGTLAFGVVGALVGRLYIDWFGFSMDGFWTGVTMALVGFLTMVFITLGMILRIRSKVRSAMAKKGRTSYVQHTEINGFGVHVSVDGEKAKLGFEKLHFVEETNDAFYIYLTAGDAWLLPKDQMADRESECAVLRDIFTKVIERKRRKLLQK